MPFCKKNKILFVHIPKTAGKSITSVMLGNTWHPRLGERNIFNRLSKLSQKLTESKISKYFLHGTIDYSFAAQHMTLMELNSLGFLSENFPSDYTSFAVVRNPFNRIKSIIKSTFRKTIQPKLGKSSITSQEDLIKTIEILFANNSQDHNQKVFKKSNIDFILNKYGEIGVDHILRYENLNVEWEKFVKNQSLNYSTKLPYLTIKNNNLIIPNFEKESARLVYSLYKDDFDILNYDKKE